MGSAEGALKARERLKARRAEDAPPDDCTLLLAGIDSLHLSSGAALRPDVVKDLLERKAEAVKCHAEGRPLPRWRTIVTVNGVAVTVELEVQPRGTRKGDLLLTSDAMAVVMHSNPPRNLPAAYVELHAVFLWCGWDYASDVGAALLRDVAAVPTSVDVQVSRIDLAADFMGWQPTPELREHLVGRFVSWKKNLEVDGSPWEEEHGRGRRFTGFTFGRGYMLARLYDKTVEIQKSGKTWFEPKWKPAGFVDTDTSGHVWRLEFQVRREVLRKCELITHEMKTSEGGEGSTEVKRWADLKKGLNDLWRYLTSKWLTYRLKRKNRKRVVLHPRWVTLMRARLTPLPDGELYRHQRLWNMERYLGALAGNARREVALELKHRDELPNEQRFEADLLRVMRAAAKHYEEKHGESLFTAARATWQQYVALEKLFGGALRRANAEQLDLVTAEAGKR